MGYLSGYLQRDDGFDLAFGALQLFSQELAHLAPVQVQHTPQVRTLYLGINFHYV